MKKLESLLRLVGEYKSFSSDVASVSAGKKRDDRELSEFDLDFVSAASKMPEAPAKKDDKK